MAGSYPDLPDNRMVLDRDSARLYFVVQDSTGPRRLDAATTDLSNLNNEAADGLGATTNVTAYLLAFPELRTLTALYLGFTQANADDWIDVFVEGSSDTTTGMDGTWNALYATNRVNQGAVAGWWGHTAPGDYRRYIRAIPAATGLRALRISVTPQNPGTTSWQFVSLHAYGSVTAGENPDRLETWDPAADHRIAGGYFDWGNVPVGSSADKTFRIKNLSSLRRANAVTLSFDALTDASPSVASQHLLSYAGSAYAASVTIPAISPGAISGLVTMRRVTPSTAVGGAWAIRLSADVASWTETLP